MSLAGRLLLSAATLVVGGAVGRAVSTVQPLTLGPAQGAQFENSDAAYAAFHATGLAWSTTTTLVSLATLGLLFLIWRRPLARALGLFGLVAALIGASPAFAYYDTADKPESFFILPNETAYFIPDVGANKESQTKFGSAEFLEANKVAAKRFEFKHQRISMPGLLSSDFYVPVGRLIIVDRTSYNREWVAAHDRGTSARNEAFPCQDSTGLNIAVGVAVAASVTEENASRYLYYFGVKTPQGNRSDPAVIFTSVYYSRGLAEVMDTVARGKIQALICDALSEHAIDEDNKLAPAIIKSAEKDASAWLGARGITLDFLGWADTFTFDRDIQQAINDRYTSEKLAPVMDVLARKAAIETMQKWDGKLPTTLSGLYVLPADVWGAVMGWLGDKGVAKKN